MPDSAVKVKAHPDQGPRVLTGTHFMVGDHACAEGALAAGHDFFAGYAITASTGIAELIARRLRARVASVGRWRTSLAAWPP